MKFADADLVGWPLQVIVGKRGVAEGKVELKRRRTGERREMSFDYMEEMMSFVNRQMRNMPQGGTNLFASFFE